jgi:hypothetical protein
MPMLEDLVALRGKLPANPKIFVMGSDATGDITHVYAAYKAEAVRGVVIFKWGGADAQKMKTSFTALGAAADHFVVVDLALGKPTSADLKTAVGVNPNRKKQDAMADADAENLATRESQRDYVTYVSRALGFSCQPLHDSSKFALAALKDDETRKAMHVDLRGVKGLTPDDEKLVEYWNATVKEFHQHVVILWGRRSGKTKTKVSPDPPNLGPHLYGDSSTTALSDIAKGCKRLAKVVVAGDVTGKENRFPDCVFIGEFWNQLKGAPYSLKEVPQKTQIRALYFLKQLLKKQAKRLVHVGMRSGNLDNYAFAGQTVVYLVPAGFDDRRTTQLATELPEGKKRWIRSETPEVPRVAYRRGLGELPAELQNVIQRTDLRLIANQERFGLLRTALGNDSYPIDPVTQVNANILYRAVKAGAGDDGERSAELLQWYLAQKLKRGLSKDYLNELITTIMQALRVEVAEAEVH